jgi:hypothetical protein
MWSSGQSFWLQIQRPGFDFRRYHIFLEVVGLERGALGLVSTIEELLGGKSSGSGLEIREYGHRDQSRWPRGTLYQQKLALASLTSGGRSGHGVLFLRGASVALNYYKFYKRAVNRTWNFFYLLQCYSPQHVSPLRAIFRWNIHQSYFYGAINQV